MINDIPNKIVLLIHSIEEQISLIKKNCISEAASLMQAEDISFLEHIEENKESMKDSLLLLKTLLQAIKKREQLIANCLLNNKKLMFSLTNSNLPYNHKSKNQQPTFFIDKKS